MTTISGRVRQTVIVVLATLGGAVELPARAVETSVPSPAPSDIRAIAEEAFLYGFPMLVGYAVLYKYFIDPASGQYKGPINQVHNEARVFTPKDTCISTPSSGWPSVSGWHSAWSWSWVRCRCS